MLGRVRGLLIDLDGVVYRGDTPTPGAAEFFARLRRAGVPFVLLTNNSSRTTAQFAEKLRGMGIPVEPSEVLTSAEATAEYLAREARPGARVLVIGESGLRDALARRGFVLDEPPFDYVVVGLDRSFDYHKLSAAVRAVVAGARLVGANPDATLPTEDGLEPGAGSLLAAVATGAGVQPRIVGKPEPAMLLLGAQRLRLPPHQVAVVGDRLDTDVLGALRAGMLAVLVLTGVTRRGEIERGEVRPHLTVADLRELGQLLLADQGQ